MVLDLKVDSQNLRIGTLRLECKYNHNFTDCRSESTKTAFWGSDGQRVDVQSMAKVQRYTRAWSAWATLIERYRQCPPYFH